MRTKLLAIAGVALLAAGTAAVGIASATGDQTTAIGGLAALLLGLAVVTLALTKLLGARDRRAGARARPRAEGSGQGRAASTDTAQGTGGAAANGRDTATAGTVADVRPHMFAAPDNDDDQPRLVTLETPVAIWLRGAVPHVATPRGLPDEGPAPRQSFQATAPDAVADTDGGGAFPRVTITHHRGDELIGAKILDVDRLPLDPTVQPTVRRHPAPDTPIPLSDLPHDPHRPQKAVDAARRARLVEVQAPVVDPVETAGRILQLTAAAVPVVATAEVAAQLPLLADDVRAALPPADGRDPHHDDLHRAAHAATLRRETWRHHDLRLRWGPDLGQRWWPQLAPRGWPSVAVVLTTRRPQLLDVALTMIAAQRDVDLEVVIALHGVDAHETATAALDRHQLPGRVLRIPDDVPFGAALDAAVAASDAPVITKWDDDDLYGPDHLLDLLIAQRQSRAGLVGKAAEFVHLQASGQTVWRRADRAESTNLWVAGGTLLLDRAMYDDVGGFPHIIRAVDHHLKVAVQAAGRDVYRTHGFGFVLRRHAGGHTWEAPDDDHRTKVAATFDGVPDVAGLGDAARFAATPVTPGQETSGRTTSEPATAPPSAGHEDAAGRDRDG